MKGGRVRNRLLKRRGLKSALKESWVRKCTAQDIKAQRHTWKEAGLENTLLKRWEHKGTFEKRFVGETLVCQRLKSCIIINIHVYQRNICSFSSLTFLFLESSSLCSKFWWFFHSCLLETHHVILTSRKGMTSTYLFAHKPLSQRSSAMPYIYVFFEKKSWSQPYYLFFGLPFNLIMLLNV